MLTSLFFGPFERIIFYILYGLITVNALYLVLKYETGLAKFLWMIFVIFVPILGAALYLINYQINAKRIKGDQIQ